MDHDMGQENGEQLAEWMVQTGHVPRKVTIHSTNKQGAQRMAQIFREAGVEPHLTPYT